MKAALADAPYGSQHTDARVRDILSSACDRASGLRRYDDLLWLTTQQNTALSTLLSILLTTKSADVPALVRKLEPTEQDTLMKYLYKGMAAPDESGGNACAVLLSWHEKVRSR